MLPAPPNPMQAGLGCWGIPGACPCWSRPGASTPSLVLLSAATQEYKHFPFVSFFCFGYIFNYKSRAWLLYSDRCLHAWGAPWGGGLGLLSDSQPPALSLAWGEGTQLHCWDQQVSKPTGTMLP